MSEPAPKLQIKVTTEKYVVVPKEEEPEKDEENRPKTEEKKTKLFFKVVRNQKTSLIDPLNILKKEPTVVPIERQLEKHSNRAKNKTKAEDQKIKEKKYNCGLEIKYTEDSDKEIEIISLKKNSLNQKVLKNLEASIDSNLKLYLKKLYCKFNYSPLIKKIFGAKITFFELEELSLIWRYYVQFHILNNEKLVEEFKDKIFKYSIDIMKFLIRNILSIIKIREALFSIRLFQIHYFHLLKKGEEKRGIDDAFNFDFVRVDHMEEIQGNGASFIFLKEFRRSLNMLIYSTKYLFYSFGELFNNDFHLMYMLQRKLFFDFFIRDCFLSSLLFTAKAIFVRSDYKEANKEVDELTLDFEYDFDDKFIKDEYAKYIFVEDPREKECLFDHTKCFNQLDYSVDKNEEKGEEIVVETEEEKKINEMKDIDELVKYIEGDSKVKKKKKKKRKENPINILDKLISQNKNIDDDLLSQSATSIISHDSVVSAFKRDLRNDAIDNNFEKKKPVISEEFLSKIE